MHLFYIAAVLIAFSVHPFSDSMEGGAMNEGQEMKKGGAVKEMKSTHWVLCVCY